MAATDVTGTLNKLLRGEIAATETYNMALDKLKDDPAFGQLQSIRDEHRTIANTWRQHIHSHGGKPDQDSGLWGYFAKTVEGGAQLFGKAAALKALKEGEEQGISDYESALKAGLPADCQALAQQMITKTRTHIATLDSLMAS